MTFFGLIQIGSGFGEPNGRPHQENPEVFPPPPHPFPSPGSEYAAERRIY